MLKIKYLEGLRGIAALCVVFCHLTATGFLVEQNLFYSYVNNLEISFVFKHFIINWCNLLLDGNLAVWIFWVLSSYVISILFFKKATDYDKIIVAYFSKRYFRLLIPVVFSILLAYLLLKLGLMYNQVLANKLGNPYETGWLQKYYKFQPSFFGAIKSGVFSTFFNFESSASYNAVLWTVQKEFFGSLFTFAIFGIIRHNARRYIFYFLIVIILFALNMAWLVSFVIGHVLSDYDFSNSNSKYVNFSKMIEQVIHRYSIIFFVLSVVLISFSNEVMSFLRMPDSYYKFTLSIIIVYSCLRNKIFQSIFSSKISFWLGKISFGLYLIHLPILCSLTSYLILVNNSLQGKIAAAAITLFVIITGAFVFTKYIDKSALVFANKTGDYFKKYS